MPFISSRFPSQPTDQLSGISPKVTFWLIFKIVRFKTMFSKISRMCGGRNLHGIQWHASKVVNVFYSNRVNPFLKNTENGSPARYNVIPQPRKTASEEERQQYAALFPDIVKDLIEPFKHIPEVTERYTKVLEYNVTNHKQASGIAVVGAYKAFDSPENLTPKNIHLAFILGWCVDLLLCSWQINDDLMDSSQTRRGLPCWYRIEGVGYQAINDAVLVENGPYVLLQKHLSGHPTYVACIEWLRRATVKTAFGQSLDTMNRLNGKPNLEAFTMTRHKFLAKYKGGIPEFSTPIKLGMYFAGTSDPNLHTQVDNLIYELGDFLTAQNDILDCYGDPSITGKVGSDIREGKCTWLVAAALQRATPAQQQILREHYGRADPESESKVHSLYEKMGILDEFLVYERDSFNQISKGIQQLASKPQQDFFFNMLKTTYGRYEQDP